MRLKVPLNPANWDDHPHDILMNILLDFYAYMHKDIRFYITYYNAILCPVLHSIFFILAASILLYGYTITSLAKSILLDSYLFYFLFFSMFMHLSQNFCVHLPIISSRLDFLGIKLLGSKMVYRFIVLIHCHIALLEGFYQFIFPNSVRMPVSSVPPSLGVVRCPVIFFHLCFFNI